VPPLCVLFFEHRLPATVLWRYFVDADASFALADPAPVSLALIGISIEKELRAAML
jgi:hypothetical protein